MAEQPKLMHVFRLYDDAVPHESAAETVAAIRKLAPQTAERIGAIGISVIGANGVYRVGCETLAGAHMFIVVLRIQGITVTGSQGANGVTTYVVSENALEVRGPTSGTRTSASSTAAPTPVPRAERARRWRIPDLAQLRAGLRESFEGVRATASDAARVVRRKR